MSTRSSGRSQAAGGQRGALAPAARRPAPHSAPGTPETSGLTEVVREIADPQEMGELMSAAVAEAYALATERGQSARPDLYGLTISALGGCTRQAAYRLAGTEPSDPDLAAAGQRRAAHHGTWLDKGLMPLVAEVTGGQVQVPTAITAGDDVIPGTADLVFADGGVVVDLKSKRESLLTRVIAAGPERPERLQGLGYGLGLHQAGMEVSWVVYLYLDRSSGAEYPVCERFTQTSIMLVLRRVWEIQKWARRPDWAPRTERGPGLSPSCDGCPWLTRCWGKGARPGQPGPQRRLARDQGAVAEVLADYQRLGVQIRQLEDERTFLRTILTAGSRPGNYGPLRWYRTAEGEQPDAEAMAEILTELGVPVPVKRRAGQVRVGPARPAESAARPGGLLARAARAARGGGRRAS